MEKLYIIDAWLIIGGVHVFYFLSFILGWLLVFVSFEIVLRTQFKIIHLLKNGEKMFRILTVHGWKYFKKFKINQNYIRLAHIFVTFGHDIGLAFAETLLTSLKSKDFLSISGKQLWRQTRICLLSLRFFSDFAFRKAAGLLFNHWPVRLVLKQWRAEGVFLPRHLFDQWTQQFALFLAFFKIQFEYEFHVCVV